MTDPLPTPEPSHDMAASAAKPPGRRWSARRRWTVAAVVTALCVGLPAGFFGIVLGPLNCGVVGERDHPGLANLSELQMHPPQATPQGRPIWLCDGDHDAQDYLVYQRFQSTDDSVKISQYYRRRLPVAGWSAVKSLGPS